MWQCVCMFMCGNNCLLLTTMQYYRSFDCGYFSINVFMFFFFLRFGFIFRLSRATIYFLWELTIHYINTRWNYWSLLARQLASRRKEMVQPVVGMYDSHCNWNMRMCFYFDSFSNFLENEPFSLSSFHARFIRSLRKKFM